jgi:hypothetical protein
LCDVQNGGASYYSTDICHGGRPKKRVSVSEFFRRVSKELKLGTKPKIKSPNSSDIMESLVRSSELTRSQQDSPSHIAIGSLDSTRNISCSVSGNQIIDPATKGT